MKKILPFSIIFKNTNIDFHFDLHDQTVDSDTVGRVCSILINEIDKEIKKNPNTSEGDLIQALALFIATRITVSSFDDKKILNFFSNTLKKAIGNINSGKKTRIGNS